jgi:hypothetical protein
MDKDDKHYCKIHGINKCECLNDPPIFRSDRERLIFLYGIITGFIGTSIFWSVFCDVFKLGKI